MPISNRYPMVCLLVLLNVGLAVAQPQEGWLDVSGALLSRLTNSGAKLDWPGGCSGVVVNPTNGDVTIKVVGQGLWRSSDRGTNWHRIDGEVVSGRDETGWATSVDPNAPGRMASFSLDGTAGWTIDGRQWKRFASLGRNWDFGSVDWTAANARTIIAAKHETTPPGEVYVTQDGGVEWRKLSVRVSENRSQISMVGALANGIFIYSNGDGIQRSTDGGNSWIKVAAVNPQTRIPVSFHGAVYLGSTNGLWVSRDVGVRWQTQGAPVDIWQGPFFGRDEAEMLVVGKAGVHVTRDGGRSWRRVTELKAKENGFLFTPNWFGCYAWDPVNNYLYASAMGNPVYRLALP